MLTIILQAQQGSGTSTFIMLIALMLIMYFFMIRPQMKKAKDEKKFVDSIQKGDKVVTLGGIHGRITEVAETTFLIEVDKNVHLRIERKAVSAEATKALNAVKQPEKKD